MDLEGSERKALLAARSDGPGQFPALGEHLLERRAGRLVDLTRPIFQGMPQYWMHQKTFIFTNHTHDTFREIYAPDSELTSETRNILISEHCGTHTDAIIEYDPEGPRIDETPLAYYWGEAVCLDLSGVTFKKPDPTGEGYATAEVIQAAEAVLNEHGQEIHPGDICLLWYDYGDRMFPRQVSADDFPGLSFDGAEYLAEKGVVNIGTDCTGIDNSLDPLCSAHMVCKKYGLVNTESLGHLDQVINQRFMFFGLPLLLQGGTGSPIRACAWLPNGQSA